MGSWKANELRKGTGRDGAAPWFYLLSKQAVCKQVRVERGEENVISGSKYLVKEKRLAAQHSSSTAVDHSGVSTPCWLPQ